MWESENRILCSSLEETGAKAVEQLWGGGLFSVTHSRFLFPIKSTAAQIRYCPRESVPANKLELNDFRLVDILFLHTYQSDLCLVLHGDNPA